MARGLYVPVCAALPRHRKLLRLATALDLERHKALGLLLDLWVWGLGSADQDGLLPDVEAADIAAAIDWRGDPDALVNSLVASGFLELDGRGFLIHDWREYGGKVVTERVADRQRKARGRASAEPPPDTVSTSGGSPPEVRRKSTVDETRREETRRENTPPPPSCPADAGGERDRVEYQAVSDAWNAICGDRMPRVETLNDSRRKAIRARWRELGGIEGLERLFRRARASAFLTGATDQGFRATLDWVLAPRNVPKVLDGNYDDRPGGGNGRDRPRGQRPIHPTLERYYRDNPDRDPRRQQGAQEDS